MTSVYGVTYIGAREQIKGKLQDRGVTQEEELNKVRFVNVSETQVPTSWCV